jgi:hypothetical protein
MTMSLQLKKIPPMELRAMGLNEKWLQDRINDDTSILGLGELEIVGREHRQPIGSRIDFLMYDADNNTHYEVEVMLGALDESHIIRTIEYWDIERQRRPQSEHRAVIVAEKITSRFFNVLRLLNRAIPLIAVQLSGFRIDDTVALHPVKVLDVIEEIADVGSDSTEQVDRPYWEAKSTIQALSIIDKVVASLRTEGLDPRLTYNRWHIALRSTGYNFCWFYPRKGKGGLCRIEFKVTEETRDSILTSFQDAGIDASPRGAIDVSFRITTPGLEDHLKLITDVLKQSEESSRA